jgi:hypothetical protein
MSGLMQCSMLLQQIGGAPLDHFGTVAASGAKRAIEIPWGADWHWKNIDR